MTTYIALLRAVNVGGTGKLPMSALTTICERIGFSSVRTYIASGNVVFDSTMLEKQAKQKLETELERSAKKPVAVLVRPPHDGMRRMGRPNLWGALAVD